MNEEEHEINDSSKMAKLLNSFFKSAFNKRNEAKKFRQLGSNEDIAEIVLANIKIGGSLLGNHSEIRITLSYLGKCPICLPV